MHTPEEQEQERKFYGCAWRLLLAFVLIIFAAGFWAALFLIFFLGL
jgi:hypothetical protein